MVQEIEGFIMDTRITLFLGKAIRIVIILSLGKQHYVIVKKHFFNSCYFSDIKVLLHKLTYISIMSADMLPPNQSE